MLNFLKELQMMDIKSGKGRDCISREVNGEHRPVL